VIISERKVAHGTETVRKFVSIHWTNMFSHKHLYNINVKYGTSDIEMCGAIDILDMDSKAGPTNFQLLGTTSTGQCPCPLKLFHLLVSKFMRIGDGYGKKTVFG